MARSHYRGADRRARCRRTGNRRALYRRRRQIGLQRPRIRSSGLCSGRGGVESGRGRLNTYDVDVRRPERTRLIEHLRWYCRTHAHLPICAPPRLPMRRRNPGKPEFGAANADCNLSRSAGLCAGGYFTTSLLYFLSRAARFSCCSCAFILPQTSSAWSKFRPEKSRRSCGVRPSFSNSARSPGVMRPAATSDASDRSSSSPSPICFCGTFAISRVADARQERYGFRCCTARPAVRQRCAISSR